MRKARRSFLTPQHRVRGPQCRTAELRARDAAHARVQPGLLEDRLCEFGPGAIPGGGEMPDAEGAVEQLSRRRGQVTRVGGSGALIVDDRDLVTLTAEVEHRRDEVRPRLAEEARRAHDPGLL